MLPNKCSYRSQVHVYVFKQTRGCCATDAIQQQWVHPQLCAYLKLQHTGTDATLRLKLKSTTCGCWHDVYNSVPGYVKNTGRLNQLCWPQWQILMFPGVVKAAFTPRESRGHVVGVSASDRLTARCPHARSTLRVSDRFLSNVDFCLFPPALVSVVRGWSRQCDSSFRVSFRLSRLLGSVTHAPVASAGWEPHRV